MADPKIFLFTNQFPFGTSEQFLETEILELAKYSDHVVVLPSTTGGAKRTLPKNVSLNLNYATYINQGVIGKMFWLVMHFGFLLRGLINHWSFIPKGDALKRILKFVYLSSRSHAWFASCYPDLGSRIILYTYWFEAATYGLSKFCKKLDGCKIITRAHGQDLYPARHHPQFLPFREESIRLVDEIFFVSQHGFDYLSNEYPFSQQKYDVAPLGVKDPGFVTFGSDDGVFRIVSCAIMVAVKRLDLLFESLVLLANQHPEKEFAWYHIGDGPLLGSMQPNIDLRSPVNLNCKLLGAFNNQDVFDFYQSNRVDVFINVSESEGVPVSIMEAFSCGIPAIATAVGGTPEIVNDENGVLLNPNPNSNEVAEALVRFFSEKSEEKRANAKLTWQDHYQAERNYREFYQKLVT